MAIIFSTTLASAAGTAGRTWSSGTGRWSRCASNFASRDLAGKGVSVVTVKDLTGTSERSAAGHDKTGKAVAGNDIVDKAVNDKDKIDAIVSPRTDDPTARVVSGARVRSCAQCLADVFVAPSTFAYFKGKPMPPIWCVACALLAAEAEGWQDVPQKAQPPRVVKPSLRRHRCL